MILGNSSGEVVHPVAQLLDEQALYLTELANDVEACEWSSPEESECIRNGLVSIADSLVSLGEFELKPIDLLAIWKPLVEQFDNRHICYRFAGMLAGAYAVQDAVSPLWKTLPQTMLQRRELPTGVVEDRGQLEIVGQRVEAVIENVRATHREYPGELSSVLYENFGNGAGLLQSRLFRALRP